MKTSFTYFKRIAFVLAAMCVLVQTASAKTFYAGPKDVYFTAPTTEPYKISVQNLTTGTLTLTLTITGSDPLLTINPSQTLTIKKDSAGKNVGYIYIQYAGGNATIIKNASILLSDGNGTTDTVWISAQDSRYHDTKHPFGLFYNGKEYLNGETFVFYHTKESTYLDFVLQNFTANELDISDSVYDPSMGGLIFGTIDTKHYIPPFGQSDRLEIGYFRSGNAKDTTYLFIIDESTGYRDKLTIIAIDSALLVTANLHSDSLFLDYTAPDTIICGDLILKNTTGSAITVNRINIYGDWTQDFTGGVLNLPLTIAVGAEEKFHVCYHQEYPHGDRSVYLMYCSFTDANGKIGAVNLVAFGSKTACYTFKPRNTLTISPTIPGGYTDADITIINTRNEFVALGEIVQSNGFHEEYFTFPDVTFPLIFLRNETKTITVHFAPTQNFQFASTNLDLKFSGASDSSCSSAHYALAGSTLDPNDTSTVSLFPSQTTSLPMASQTDKITKKFFFRNNASSATKVVSVTMKDGSHFRIVSTNPTAPATLQASGSMEVDIEFDAGANGFYTDDLIIVTDHALTSQTFRMQAIRTNGTSGVNEIAAANPQFVISPNPAHNEVTIHSQNINVRTIGIYDVLGNLISDVKNASEWKWNIPSLVTDGTYFVRMEGTLPGGKGYVTTQKVLIVK